MKLTSQQTLKIEDFTEGQQELLKSLAHGCNIALYRNGECRLRDAKHNPLKKLRMDLFEKIREFTVQKDGLFILDEEKRKVLPIQILR